MGGGEFEIGQDRTNGISGNCSSLPSKLRFDIPDLLLAEDQQTVNRRPCDCPHFKEQLNPLRGRFDELPNPKRQVIGNPFRVNRLNFRRILIASTAMR